MQLTCPDIKLTVLKYYDIRVICLMLYLGKRKDNKDIDRYINVFIAKQGGNTHDN